MNTERVTSLQALQRAELLGNAVADVGVQRERSRQSRLAKVAVVVVGLAVVLWWRQLTGNPVVLGPPMLSPKLLAMLPSFMLVGLIGVAVLIPFIGAGRSPHVLYRPSEIDVSLDDVKGAGVVVEEVTRTLNLFLAFKTFRDAMGGTPRRGVLFEGPPGTGKTYMARAMAREAGVPFLFVSSSAFQSMYYGQTNRKIRSYFKALRKAARREGGAIGFIEEIDAIGAARTGMGSSSREGVTGVVNELLIQLQSFDTPPLGTRLRNWAFDVVNRWLPTHRQLRRQMAAPANVLVIGATNRATDLDPALLRPGRFDRSIYFDLPSRAGRREIIDHYLDRKAHTPDLDDVARRDQLAAMTFAYSPVMIEHLLDEALVWALRRGADALDWADIQQAKMTEEIGLAQPVEYNDAERERIATHEAGHATIAALVGVGRNLEVLSIIKRRDALGLLAHSDAEESFTKTRTEMHALVRIAMGGMAAEELFFGEAGTGPAGDLQVATTLAAQMVGSMGMAGSLVSFEAMDAPGARNVVAKVVADDSARESLEGILDAAKAAADQMLFENCHIVEALRDALLERDELIAGEITDVIEQAQARHAAPAEVDLRTNGEVIARF
jgi:cell division protease FtsH